MSRWPPREEMQARILQTTDRLFYEQGIRATGVDAVAGEVGISKRTLYDYYPSKEDLIAAYLSRRLIDIEITDRPPREQILGVFDQLERTLGRKRFRGCAFVNAVAELGGEVREVSSLAVAFKERRRQWFRELLSRLAVDDADTLSMQLAVLLDGAIAAGLVRGDPAFVRAARDAAATLIDARRRGKARR